MAHSIQNKFSSFSLKKGEKYFYVTFSIRFQFYNLLIIIFPYLKILYCSFSCNKQCNNNNNDSYLNCYL